MGHGVAVWQEHNGKTASPQTEDRVFSSEINGEDKTAKWSQIMAGHCIYAYWPSYGMNGFFQRCVMF